jgi:transketolase
MAMGLKRKNYSSFIYNLMSDGELGEGSTWEAAMAGAHHQLDNLIAVVDFNNQQADGASRTVLSSEPVDRKFEAFGWHVQRVNGNDIEAVRNAFDRAREHTELRPRAIICDTRMCKGVPFLEAREITHFIRVEPDEWAKALAVLDAEHPR